MGQHVPARVLFIIGKTYGRIYNSIANGKGDNAMPTSASITTMKMIESLSEPVQESALEHMQQYVVK
jgi:hypothetical protein